jgi:protein-tyrosine-phosphatase
VPTVLFVCTENANRSQMAEGLTHVLGRGKVAAYSAGSRPSGEVNPRAVRLMQEHGIDVSKQRSKGLDDLPHARWDYVVTMGCGDACPTVPARQRLEWELPDPKDLDDAGFRAVRDRIEGLVRDLIAAADAEGSEQRS